MSYHNHLEGLRLSQLSIGSPWHADKIKDPPGGRGMMCVEGSGLWHVWGRCAWRCCVGVAVNYAKAIQSCLFIHRAEKCMHSDEWQSPLNSA
eukprot:281820-Pelagomonas_calceolata.AAC.1